MMTRKVQTVLGPIDPMKMGVTLSHEHLVFSQGRIARVPEEASRRWYADKPFTMDMVGKANSLWYINRANGQLYDEAEATAAIDDFMLAGGNTVVDVTNWDLGRDPLALARISRATGLNIIMGAGHYVPEGHPPDMDDRSEESILERLVRDVTLGVGDTGIKAGVIGELGNVHPLTENQFKVLRAGARAHAETGAPVSIHPGNHRDSHLEILEVLDAAGCPPERVVMGHLSWTIDDLDTLRRIAGAGCYLEFDTIGFETSNLQYEGAHMDPSSDAQNIEYVEYLAGAGFVDKILVSQDVCMKWWQASYGGKGHAHVLENIVPRMKSRGWTEAQLNDMLIDNPARAFAFA